VAQTGVLLDAQAACAFLPQAYNHAGKVKQVVSVRKREAEAALGGGIRKRQLRHRAAALTSRRSPLV
jgi:hypothetical protein